MDNSNLYLGTEKIGKLMKQYTIPCIISLLVGALYNIVDQILLPTLLIWALTAMRQIPWYFP